MAAVHIRPGWARSPGGRTPAGGEEHLAEAGWRPAATQAHRLGADPRQAAAMVLPARRRPPPGTRRPRRAPHLGVAHVARGSRRREVEAVVAWPGERDEQPVTSRAGGRDQAPGQPRSRQRATLVGLAGGVVDGGAEARWSPVVGGRAGVWPPDTRRVRNGSTPGARGRRRWASRWFTPTPGDVHQGRGPWRCRDPDEQ